MTSCESERAFAVVVAGVAIALLAGSCRSALPPIRFAPSGTDVARLRSDFALTDAERLVLTPANIKELVQEQVDQIYERLSAGPIPDGSFRGDLFFPRGVDKHATLRDVSGQVPSSLEKIAALPVERIGRALWKGKAFYKSQGILRNRIEELALLKPLIDDTSGIQRMNFDGQTTWMLFPAKVTCGESRLDPTRPSIVIDYARGSEVEGYRPVPDKLAGPEGLNIRDEIRVVRPGFYLGRAYFGSKFGLNFTLLDPTKPAGAPLTPDIRDNCGP